MILNDKMIGCITDVSMRYVCDELLAGSSVDKDESSFNEFSIKPKFCAH